MELSDIERKIESRDFVAVREGRGGKCSIVELNGQKYFHKEYPTFPPDPEDVAAERAEFNGYKFGMPSTCYIDNDVTAADRAAKEFTTMRAWSDLRIATPKAVFQEGGRLVYEFMPGNSFANSLDGVMFVPVPFGRVLDCYHRIRRVAAENGEDIELLHNDPFVDNFFYDSSKHAVVPLDPAKVLVPRGFKETDGRIALFSLCKLFHLDTTPDNHRAYLVQAVDRFSGEERQAIAELNTDPREAREYFESKGKKWGAHRLSIYYSRETLGAIQDALTK